MTIDLGRGKSLKITSTGGNSDSEYYVQSLKVKGEVWDMAWLTWDDVFADGETIDSVLGPNPSEWSRDGVLSPSPAS